MSITPKSVPLKSNEINKILQIGRIMYARAYAVHPPSSTIDNHLRQVGYLAGAEHRSIRRRLSDESRPLCIV
jgi:hypothetical protein